MSDTPLAPERLCGCADACVAALLRMGASATQPAPYLTDLWGTPDWPDELRGYTAMETEAAVRFLLRCGVVQIQETASGVPGAVPRPSPSSGTGRGSRTTARPGGAAPRS